MSRRRYSTVPPASTVRSSSETRYSVVCTATPPGRRQAIWATTKSRPAASVPRCSRAHDDQVKSKPRRSLGTSFMSTGRKRTRRAELLVGDEPEGGQALDALGPLHLGLGPARGQGQLAGLVGGHQVTALGREQRHQRLLAHAEAEARAPGREHAPLGQRLGDEQPLPHLAVQHHLAAVRAVGRPHGAQAIGPGPQGGGAQRRGGAELGTEHVGEFGARRGAAGAQMRSK